MNRIFQSWRKYPGHAAPAITFALALTALCVSPVAAGPSRYALRAGGFGSSAGAARADNYRLTGSLARLQPGGMSGDGLRLTGSLWTPGSFCLVEFDDFALFADQWLEKGPGLSADLDTDRDVDFEDVRRFSQLWLCVCPHGWPLQ